MFYGRHLARRLCRRDFLKGIAGVGAVGAMGCAALPRMPPRRSDLIQAENEKPGTTDWLLTNTRLDDSKYRCPWIEGYCSRPSVRAGEKLAILVSTNPPSPFVIDLYRMGYYGGKGGRHVMRLGPFPGKTQQDPDVGRERLRECRWAPTAEIEIPKDWPSGVYVGKLTEEKEKLQSYVIFVVRDDRACDFLFQCSDLTWLAYNRWPSLWSMYHHESKKMGEEGGWCGPNVRVSWDRPYARHSQWIRPELSQGSGEFLVWEFPVAYWMEQHGYDVSYTSNVDTHTDAEGLLRAKAFLSVGHDEYWSLEMFNNVKAAVASGINAAFFSGDTMWGVIGFEPGALGVSHRIISRIGLFGTLDEEAADAAALAKVLKNFPEYKLLPTLAPSEGTLVGARNVYPYLGEADWVCTDEKNWIYEGTGMKNGDHIPGLIGYEWNGGPADIPGLRVVAQGKVYDLEKEEGIYAATIYPGPRGNFVFNGATIWWGEGLSAPPGMTRGSKGLKAPDSRVQRITSNLLNRFRA